MIAEKDGSYTINVNGGNMSIRNYGLGTTYKTASEAFKDADYATAIQRPQSSPTSSFWGFVGALFFVAIFAWGFWATISRF